MFDAWVRSSRQAVARISADSSHRSTEKTDESPFALEKVRRSLFCVTRALICHLLEYGLRASIGVERDGLSGELADLQTRLELAATCDATTAATTSTERLFDLLAD